jgi:hypothetical protein
MSTVLTAGLPTGQPLKVTLTTLPPGPVHGEQAAVTVCAKAAPERTQRNNSAAQTTEGNA